MPGESMKYVYDIPKDHTRGIYWYHPHFDGSSALQVASGMVGALIVEDDLKTMPSAIGAMRERLIVFHEVAHSNPHWPWPNPNIICYFCIDNFAWPSGDRVPMNKVFKDEKFKKCGKEPLFYPGTKNDFAQTTQPFDCTYLLLSGAYMPDITMRPGEWQRLRLVQSSHNSAMRLGFPVGCQAILLAMDGLYLSTPRNITVTDTKEIKGFVFTAGSRADIAVMCPEPGAYNVNTLTGGTEWSHVSWFKSKTKEMYEPVVYPQQIATIVVTGDPIVMKPPLTLPPMGCYPDLMKAKVSAKYTVVYNLTAYGTEPKAKIPSQIGQFLNGGQFSINGKSFLNRPTRCMLENTVEEWTIVNTVNDLSRWLHSFHIHVNPYQVVSMNMGINPASNPEVNTTGQLMVEDLRPGDWRDTVQVPVGGNVTIRILNKDFVGPFPFHCHVTAHQGIGMMQLVEVVKDKSQCTGRLGEETGLDDDDDAVKIMNM